MNKSDFRLRNIDKSDGHIDYWYSVIDESQDELANKYREQCMVTVSSVVYSKDEDIVGVERIFDWNKDVIIVDDNELKNILIELSV